MSEEIKSLLTLLGIMFLSAGAVVALFGWLFLSKKD